MNKNIVIAVVVFVLLLIVGVGAFLVMGSKGQNQTKNDVGSMDTMPRTTQNTNTESKNPVATNNIEIKGFAYNPATITVKVGTTVTWMNSDSVGHTATAEDGSFDTGILRQGEKGSVTFSKAGTFKYFCSVHPNMKGTVIVTE